MKKFLGLALTNMGAILLAAGAYVITAIVIAARPVNFWVVLPVILGGLNVIAGISTFMCAMKHEKEHKECLGHK